MKRGFLSEHFEGVAAKTLSPVEADPAASNQHEFNGVGDLKQILGESVTPTKFETRFIYLCDHDADAIVEDAYLTWYDARAKARIERSVNRSEYRLYFPPNTVLQVASAGDLLIIARRPNGSLLAIVAECGSTIARQLQWLFGLGDLDHPGFSVKSELETEQDKIGFAARFVLEQVGIELQDEDPNFLDEMLKRFDGAFPKTAVFSAYARETCNIDGDNSADASLMAWMEREEILFRTLEKHLLGDRLRNLHNDTEIDPDAFMKLTLSFLQRRKSRAGSALENHLEAIFQANRIRYTRTGITEKNLRPDFVFPSIEKYHDKEFPVEQLTVLAAKTTCKDRWRQILNEAARVKEKHLLTLEPSISENQTAEMLSESVQLVLPRALHATYTAEQQKQMIDLTQFLQLAKERQS